MKTSRFIKKALILAFISVFAGCSNLIDSKDDSSVSQDENQGKFVVSLGLKAPGAKAIRAFDYSISEIEQWKLTLTDKNNSEISLTTGEQTAENSPSLTYDANKGTITATKIPAGTYTVSLEGSYTKDSATYTISGSAGGVAISADSSGKATILLGPKSTESGTGSISLTFTNSDQEFLNLASSLKITLTNLSSSSFYYTTDSSDTQNSGLLTFDSSSLKLSGKGIKSGWYKISFSAGDTYRVYLPDEPSQFVEIADGTETTATTAISAESGKVYYATNSSSSYNGLTSSSPINLTTLIKNLTEKMPEEGEIFIYDIGSTPDIYIEKINLLKDKITKESLQKKIYIYRKNTTENIDCLQIGDGEGKATTSLLGSIDLYATDGNTTFVADKFSVSTSYTSLYLYDGAIIDASNVTDATGFSTNNTISVSLKKNYTEINLDSYIDTPFFIAGTDLSDYLKLQDGKDSYTITTKTENNVVNHYVQVVGNGTITAESFAEKVSVGAAYESDSSTPYTTDAAIPYTNDNLTFSLSGLDNESATYAWYLNETDLSATTATLSFNPYEESNIDISGTNTVSCKVTISGTTYVAEMKFTFCAAGSAAVWFDGINMSSQTYNLKQLADDTDTITTASELATATSSTLYCFDSDFNLWTAMTEDSGFKLTKHLINVETGLYNPAGISTTLEDITTAIDMTYDTKNGCLYLLTENEDSSYTLYKIQPVGTDSTFTLQNTSGTLLTTTERNDTFTPAQIAVYDSTLYVGAGSASIYKAELTESDNNTLTVGTPSTWLLIHNSLNSKDLASCTITDMQIGDGLGNETDNLFVILRQYTDKIILQGTSEENPETDVYSRGTLVQIAIADSTLSCNNYGWSSDSSVIKNDAENYGTLYAPNSSSESVNFYGPTHFVAVVPKKLVILDDGFSYESENTLRNQDSLMEFDISNSALSRGASVSATKPSYSSGFTWN